MISINRDNYETLFLLYADNELSATEKNAVEEFVAANPDLQEELALLQEAVLKPETISFNDKAGLFRSETISAPVQVMLLMHLDNELAAAEASGVTALIKEDAVVKKEWDILQQTKIPLSQVVFEDKKSLYRKETGRVVVFPWRKLAVAAVLIGFGAWGTLLYFNNNKQTTGGQVANVKPLPGIAAPATKQPAVSPYSPITQPDVATTVTPQNKKAPIDVAVRPVQKIMETRLSKRKNESIAAIEPSAEPTNSLPRPHSENLNSVGRNEPIPDYVILQKQSRSIADPGNDVIGKNTDSHSDANVYATTTSYTDNTEQNNNRVLFMDEEKIKKTKLGGFFRKVKRVLERSTNSKTEGNNIKVANLEFAIQ